jgi:hypothetical protein
MGGSRRNPSAACRDESEPPVPAAGPAGRAGRCWPRPTAGCRGFDTGDLLEARALLGAQGLIAGFGFIRSPPHASEGGGPGRSRPPQDSIRGLYSSNPEYPGESANAEDHLLAIAVPGGGGSGLPGPAAVASAPPGNLPERQNQARAALFFRMNHMPSRSCPLLVLCACALRIRPAPRAEIVPETLPVLKNAPTRPPTGRPSARSPVVPGCVWRRSFLQPAAAGPSKRQPRCRVEAA